VTLTFDLLTSGSMRAERLPYSMRVPSSVLIAQAVFLLEHVHTHTETHSHRRHLLPSPTHRLRRRGINSECFTYGLLLGNNRKAPRSKNNSLAEMCRKLFIVTDRCSQSSCAAACWSNCGVRPCVDTTPPRAKPVYSRWYRGRNNSFKY